MVMSGYEADLARKRAYWARRKNVPDDALKLTWLPQPRDPWDFNDSPAQCFALSINGYESPCVEEVTRVCCS